MTRIALLTLLLTGCTINHTAPDKVRVDLYIHQQPCGDGLPEAAHIVLPAVKPEGGSK